jgi:hypothetical protein
MEAVEAYRAEKTRKAEAKAARNAWIASLAGKTLGSHFGVTSRGTIEDSYGNYIAELPKAPCSEEELLAFLGQAEQWIE